LIDLINFSLSPRLKAVLECVKKCDVLADIGTDHAYLPIEAVRENFCQRAIACDINTGPLEIAKKNILAVGFENRIETRLGDGLQPLCENEADCIVITGMGGMRILEILSATPVKAKNARLILQAQHDMEELRRFLHSNMYNIIEEKLIRERSRFYVILVAQSADASEIVPWTDAEYFLGKIESSDLILYLREMNEKIMGYIHSISDEETKNLAKKRLAWITIAEKSIRQHSEKEIKKL